MIGGLVPGDTLVLASGEYPRLIIANLAGVSGRCITITGPAGDRPAVILGEIGNRTVQIIDSSYIVIAARAAWHAGRTTVYHHQI